MAVAVVFQLLLACLSLHLPGCLCQLVFTDSPASTTALLYHSITLRCLARDPAPPFNILWQKDGVLLRPSENRTAIVYDSSTGSSSYTINSALYSDAGSYQCFAVDRQNQIQAESTSGTLTVQGQPIFDPTPPIITALGSQATLPCDVQSSPAVTNVSWSLRNQPLASGGRILITQTPPYTLTITSVQSTDVGYYVCAAQNSFGRNSTTVRLTIGTPPPQLMLNISPSGSQLSINEGENLVLSCSAPDGTQLSSFQWLRSGTPIIAGVTQRSNELVLTISSIQLEDGGVYECTAVDSQTSTDSRSIAVIVNVPPVFSVEPNDISVMESQSFTPPRCTANGDPVPTITWLRPSGINIPVQGGVPQFGALTRDDSGTYVCVASNSAGDVRSEFEITVQGAPLITLSPTDIVATYGQDITFQCEAVGPPNPGYSWNRINGALPVSSVVSGSMLHLFSVTSSDSGTYQCTASNSHGSNSAAAVLTVQAPPQITATTSTPQYFLVGTSFTLDCTFSGPPNTFLNWYLNNTLLSSSTDQRVQILSNGSLAIANPTTSYSGVYTCNVSTSATFVTAQISVAVGEPPLITTTPSSVDLTPGSTAFLQCVSRGIPQPWVTWYRTDVFGIQEELSVLGTTYTRETDGLRLHDVARGDSGMYECLVDNRLGTDNRTAMVRVEGPPITTGIQPTVLTAGDSVTLECLTSINFPAGSVSWSRTDGTSFPRDRFIINLDGTLLITSVMEGDDGEIECTVANTYGQSSSRTIITVNFAPSISLPSSQNTVLIQDQVRLSCPSTGSPEPTITWTLPDGSTVPANSPFFNPVTMELFISSARGRDVGVYTCTAQNTIGSASAEIELIVQGPPVNNLFAFTTTLVISVTWTPPINPVDLQSYLVEIGYLGQPQEERMTFNPIFGVTRITTNTGLLSGQLYEVMIRGVYANGVLGIPSYVNVTTTERAPNGPPQNIVLSPRQAAVYITWEQPLLEDRNGEIVSYDIFYRLKPANSSIDTPFEGILYLRNDSDTEHLFTLDELEEEQIYEVMMRASTFVGPGPNSTLFEAMTLKHATFLSVNYPLVINIVTGVAAALGGILIITAVVIALFIFIYWIRRKCKQTEGSFKPLSGEEGRQKKSRKSVSRPIPAITPKIDPSGESKFSMKSKDGTVLSTNPKIITEADVDAPPLPGQKVKVVPREKIMGSRIREYEVYQTPADALDDPNYSSVTITTSKPPKQQPKQVESSPEPEVEYHHHDDHNDESQLVYASVSTDHKAKKRAKLLEEQQKKDLKAEKERRKMEEKMEREQKKREARERMAAEKEKKKRARDSTLRSSMGLDNIVRLQDVDLSSDAGRAQAQFIDAATAAIF